MANPEIYAHTYWSHKGKYPATQEALAALVPAEGEVKDHENNPALEKFRIAANCYYDLYNNGLCNRWEEFEEVFGFVGPYREEEADEDDDDSRSYYIDNDETWWTQANIDRVEDGINVIILAAAKEQGITVPEMDATAIQAEVDRLSAELASNHAKLTEIASKPFVQLSGEDGNVFSIIGRVSGALRKAKLPDKAEEFTDKAFGAGSYNEVLRLAMEYCDVA